MKLITGAVLLAAMFSSTAALADERIVNVPLADVLAMPEAQTKLDGSVRFYLAHQKTPAVRKRLGEDTTSRKTNNFGKKDIDSCKWVTLSTLIALQDGAKKAGGNAAINIVSNYNNIETSNEGTVECHAGFLMSGVALKASYARLGK
jgi:hypothetical protein